MRVAIENSCDNDINEDSDINKDSSINEGSDRVVATVIE
jgi:hypothetical protein